MKFKSIKKIKRGRPQILPSSGGVYAIWTPEGNLYIGSTHNFASRWSQYRSDSCISIVADSMRKHRQPGKQVFVPGEGNNTWYADGHKFEILLDLPPKIDQAYMELHFEKLYIDHYLNLGHNVINKNLTGGRGKEKIKVEVYLADGTFFGKFKSQREATKETGIAQSTISRVLQGKMKNWPPRGYIFTPGRA